MKVLFVITQSSWGGAQKYVFDLAGEFSRQEGLEVSIAGGEESQGILAQQLSSAQLEFMPLKHLIRSINPLHDLLAVLELKKLIDHVRPDVIHLNSSKAGAVGSVAARLAKHRAKIIYTVHGWVFNESLNPLIKAAYLAIEMITGRFKDHIICLSDFDRNAGIACHVSRPEKLTMIRNGISLSADYFLPREKARRELGLAEDGSITIGCIANFYANKGLSYLIESVRIVNRSGARVQAVIIGDGQQRAELEKKITELNLGDQVILAGSLPSAGRYLKAFDIAAISSIKEGVPYFLLEAMSAGLPIVATSVGGMPEIIENGKTGLLVPPKNTSLLAEAIERLIADKGLREDFGRAGLAKIEAEFNRKKMLSQTLSIYQS